MRDPEAFLLDDDYDDPIDSLALTIDLARPDLDDEYDDARFRTLFENPAPLRRADPNRRRRVQ